MYIIKLGGSVITDKSKEAIFKNKIMDNLSKEIKKANKRCIIIHGAGSFGHILAKKYNLNNGFKNQNQLKGFSETIHMVQILNNHVLKSLNQNSNNSVSIAPHNILKFKNHDVFKINFEIFSDYIKKNIIPVTFGDVVLDEDLAKYFKPEKVIFIIDEDGLYTSNPKEDKNAELINNINHLDLRKLSTKLDNHADVTRGMEGKINMISKIAKLGINTILLNGNKAERLYGALTENKIIGTIVQGEKNESNWK